MIWVWCGAGLAAYLLGSIPFGLLIGKRRGVDVRTTGSGNIGATNVARSVGKKLGALVLLLDALKGALPVIGLRVAAAQGVSVPPAVVAAVALAAIVGHCYPVWLRFRGGKGVATALGVFLAVDPAAAGVGVGVFALLYLAFRVVSLGSVTAAIAIPTFLALAGRPPAIIGLGVAGALIVIVKHRGNLARLLRREELKV